MELDIMQIFSIITSIIGVATVGFRIVAPITETKQDDKILKALEIILRRVALNKDEGTITVKVDKK